MRAEKLRQEIYANIHYLGKYGVKDADKLEKLVEDDKKGDLIHLTPLRAIYKLIQRTKFENDRPKRTISIDSDEDDFSDGDDDSDHDVTVTEIETEKNEDEKVDAVSVLIQQSKLWQSKNRTEKTNEKRSDPSTSKDGSTHRDSVHPPLQELSTNVKFSASDGSSSSNRAISALQRSVAAFRAGGDDFSSCDEGIPSVSTVDFEEQHTGLELTPPARIFKPKCQGVPAHLNGNIPSKSTSAAVFDEKLEPIKETAEERVPHRLPYQTNTTNNGMNNNSSVARKTSPIIPLISRAASRTYRFNSAKLISSGKTTASTSVLQHRYRETFSHWQDPYTENKSWNDHSTAPGPYGSYSSISSSTLSRNASIATSITNPSMHRQKQITTLIKSTNHRKSPQQTTHGFSGSSNRTRDVSAPLTTKSAIIQKLPSSEYNPTDHATAPKSKITQRTNNAIRQLANQKQPTVATANKLTDEKHKPRSRTITSVSQRSNMPSKKIKTNRFDAKPSTSQRNDVKPSKSKRDDDGPSTSKRYSNESAHSTEFERETLLLLEAINKRFKIPMLALKKIAEDVQKNKSKSVHLASQMNPMPVVSSTSHNISPNKDNIEGKLNLKRYHDPTTKQILFSREMDDLNDPGSMYYYANDLPLKRRRKSTHVCMSLDDSEPSHRLSSSSARAANRIRNSSFANDDSRHSNTSYSTHAMGPSTIETRRIKEERMDGELETVQTDRSRDVNHQIDKMSDKIKCLYLSLEHCYMRNDPKMIVKLTPWLLGDDILGHEKQLRPVTLYALYKCMAENCIFSTNDEKAMDQHLMEHEILVALLLRRDANRNLSARQRSGWLKCAYCVHEATSIIEIIRHTKMEHGNCAFQCSLCFYRTIEIANIDSHIVKCHPVDDTAQILVCKRELKSLDNERMEMVRNRKKYLPPYIVRTDEGTEEHFYVKEDFEERLDATTVPYYDCSLCEFSDTIPKSNALQHLTCHGLHMYHCLHCHYGAMLSQVVLDHMHENHPSKLLYLSSRKFYKTPPKKDDVETTVIVDMGNSKEEMLKKWRITVCPYSETQLNFMGAALRSIVRNEKDPPGGGQFVNINVEDISRAYRLKETQDAFLTQDDFDKLIEAEK